MGLGFSHGHASWSYGGFASFRTKLAREIGINLHQMEGYASDKAFTCAAIALNQVKGDAKTVAERQGVNTYFTKYIDELVAPKPMKWDKIKDPIKDLLFHSDCEGNLTVTQCIDIAPRLRDLVADWPEEDFDKGRALDLADAMTEAAEAGEPLEFC